MSFGGGFGGFGMGSGLRQTEIKQEGSENVKCFRPMLC